MSPPLKHKAVLAIICASIGALIVGAAITPVVVIADYLYQVRLQPWPFCVSGACLGIAAVSVKNRISLAIVTTVIVSLVVSMVTLAIESVVGTYPGPMTQARIVALYIPAFANGFVAILVPFFHRPFHKCKSRFWKLITCRANSHVGRGLE